MATTCMIYKRREVCNKGAIINLLGARIFFFFFLKKKLATKLKKKQIDLLKH
jgi:hypothetical protein